MQHLWRYLYKNLILLSPGVVLVADNAWHCDDYVARTWREVRVKKSRLVAFLSPSVSTTWVHVLLLVEYSGGAKTGGRGYVISSDPHCHHMICSPSHRSRRLVLTPPPSVYITVNPLPLALPCHLLYHPSMVCLVRTAAAQLWAWPSSTLHTYMYMYMYIHVCDGCWGVIVSIVTWSTTCC